MEKTERINLRITPKLKERLQAAASAENRSISNYIEHLIKMAIEEKN